MDEKFDSNDDIQEPVPERFETLGTGGQGEVKKVTYSDGKVVVWKYLTEPAREHLAIGIKHPNIAEVYSTREENGKVIIEREYVPGESLEELINKKGKYCAEESIEIINEVLDGLALVHRRGILHRDIKPSNIIIGKNGVKIIDFGLAVQHKYDDLQSFTTQPQISGTLPYMAPEALEGKTDTRSDMYSVGAVMYRMLTGNFHIKLVSEARDVLLEELRKPLQNHAEPLVDAVMKSIRGRSESRYQYAWEMRNELQRLADEWTEKNTAPKNQGHYAPNTETGRKWYERFLEQREVIRKELLTQTARIQRPNPLTPVKYQNTPIWNKQPTASPSETRYSRKHPINETTELIVLAENNQIFSIGIRWKDEENFKKIKQYFFENNTPSKYYLNTGGCIINSPNWPLDEKPRISKETASLIRTLSQQEPAVESSLTRCLEHLI